MGCFNNFETNEYNNLQRNFNNQYTGTGNYNYLQDNSLHFKNNVPIYDYKSNHINQYKINLSDDKNILENLLIFIKDQNGCKILQKKLEEKNYDFNIKFFEKVKIYFNF